MTVLRATGAQEGAPRAYLRALRERFDAACAAAGDVEERRLEIAGQDVTLRFAGSALVPVLMPALSHLSGPEDAESGSSTFLVFDSASTGVEPPPFPWRRDRVLARGEVAGFDQDGVRTALDGTGLTMHDRHDDEVVCWMRDAASVPWYARAAPLRTALHWTLTGPGRHLVHAGVVGDERGGVLLGGKGGSGKTTTCLACLDAGLGYAGDDYVLFALEPEPTAHSLFASAKVDPAGLARVPGLTREIDAPTGRDGEKAVLDLSGRLSGGLRRQVPVRALLLPAIADGGEPTRLRPVSGALGLRLLAPSSVLQLPHGDAEAFTTLVELVRRVPSYALELGPDGAEAAPRLIADLLDSGAAT